MRNPLLAIVAATALCLVLSWAIHNPIPPVAEGHSAPASAIESLPEVQKSPPPLRDRPFSAQVRSSLDEQSLPLEILRRPGSLVEGVVIDSSGEPIADARVRVGAPMREMPRGTWVAEGPLPEGEGILEVLSDASGRFRLVGIDGREVSLRAWHPRFSPSSPVNVHGSVTDVQLRLSSPTAVRGTVIDEHGKPLAGIEVREACPNSLASPVRTDAEGTFTLSGATPGSLGLQATAVHFPTDSAPLVPALAAGEERSGVVLGLFRGATLIGRVVDEDSRPIVGAECIAHEPGSPPRFATTDATGNFAIHGIRAFLASELLEGPPPHFDLSIAHPGFLESETRLPHDLTSGETRDGGTIRLRRAPVVSGRIVDESGRGVPRADVVLHRAGNRPNFSQLSAGERRSTTDPDGSFEIMAPHPQDYEISAKAAGFRTTTSERFPVAKDHRVLPDLILGVGSTLEGKLIDVAGRPVPEARLTIDSGQSWSQTRTDRTGNFRFEGLAQESYRILIQDHGWEMKEKDTRVTPQADPIIVVVIPPGRIEGVALDPAGHRILEFAVSFSKGPLSSEQRPAFFLTGDGSFTEEALLPGPLAVRVESPGYAPWNGKVRIEPGKTTRIEARLPHPASIQGRVIDSSGHGIGGVSVRILQGEVTVLELVTESDGAFSWNELRAGKYRGVVELESHVSAELETFTIEGGEWKTFPAITLFRSASLGGGLWAPDGLPPDSAKLLATKITPHLSREGEYWREDGEYLFEELPPGKYWLTIRYSRDGHERLWRGTVEVEEGEDWEYPIDLGVKDEE